MRGSANESRAMLFFAVCNTGPSCKTRYYRGGQQLELYIPPNTPTPDVKTGAIGTKHSFFVAKCLYSGGGYRSGVLTGALYNALYRCDQR